MAIVQPSLADELGDLLDTGDSVMPESLQFAVGGQTRPLFILKCHSYLRGKSYSTSREHAAGEENEYPCNNSVPIRHNADGVPLFIDEAISPDSERFHSTDVDSGNSTAHSPDGPKSMSPQLGQQGELPVTGAVNEVGKEFLNLLRMSLLRKGEYNSTQTQIEGRR
jgi:hypothetical protein